MKIRPSFLVGFLLFAALPLAAAGAASPRGAAVKPDAPALTEDYNQWKEALAGAAPQTNLTAPPGFVVELVRAARPGEGSWVSFAFDPRGRVVIGREDRGLLRFGAMAGLAAAAPETFATNLLECRGLLFAHGALYANANNSKGLYRLRDTDGDDAFDEVRLLQATAGGVGHGRNDLVLGPDGFIYSIHGDDVRVPPEASARSPFRTLAPGGLLPCAWQQHLYGNGVTPPGGHVVRTDQDGRNWEVLAAGLRNPYGLDFNPDGELFTYDADLEWDIGLPWYHATRVLHLVPGADYGWRRNADNLPVWLPDSRPAVVDLGKGSPTAIRFGTRSHFPPAYRRALFLLDWAYGRIWAVQLTPQGASYRGRAEIFLQGRPLNVTDLEFGPDGALWFTTGGRGTRSGLYRVRHSGPAVKEPKELADQDAAEARALRRALEARLGDESAAAIEFAWPHLDHADGWVRHAARLVVERQPAAAWQARALTEPRPRAGVEALLALARAGGVDFSGRVFARFGTINYPTLPPEQKLAALRAVEVACIHWGKPDAGAAAELRRRLEALFPDADAQVNQQLVPLLVRLESPAAVDRTLPRLASAATPEEKLHYLRVLGQAKAGWSPVARRSYFAALKEARPFPGTHYLPLVLQYLRAEAVASLSDTERAELAGSLAPPEPPPVAVVPRPPNRRFVKAWQAADFTGALARVNAARDLARGRALYAEAGCRECHRFAGDGGLAGPELTSAGGRYAPRDLLEAILEPSRVVAEGYRQVSVTAASGEIMEGRLVAEDDDTLTLANNPVDPDHRRTLRKHDLTGRHVSDVSPMPAALLDAFAEEEVLDLLAFVIFGAEAQVAAEGSRPRN